MSLEKRIIRNKKRLKSYLNKKDVKADLIVFDDVFPNPLSDWRLNEFLYYLENIKNTVIVSGYGSTKFNTKTSYSDYFNINYPQHKNKLIEFNIYHKYNAKLGYCLFYNNLKLAFTFFEKFNIPFVFTLYPGGGFRFYDSEIENTLERYFSSVLFKHVIVNMPHVYYYLIGKFNLNSSQITLIYGVPIELPPIQKRVLTNGKIKVLFSSHKYTPYGIDKGFDIFNRVAKCLEKDGKFLFSVLGGFTEKDLVVQTNNIEFIPELINNVLSEEMQNYDIILSPNRSHILHLGAFDGFPTGSVMHAANSGCLMMITDDWDNSEAIGLIDNIDFIRISTNVSEIINKLKRLANDRAMLNFIANNGKNKINKLVDSSTQLNKRGIILSKYL